MRRTLSLEAVRPIRACNTVQVELLVVVLARVRHPHCGSSGGGHSSRGGAKDVEEFHGKIGVWCESGLLMIRSLLLVSEELELPQEKSSSHLYLFSSRLDTLSSSRDVRRYRLYRRQVGLTGRKDRPRIPHRRRHTFLPVPQFSAFKFPNFPIPGVQIHTSF